MADDITDLTEDADDDGDNAAKGQKKGKKEKKAKAPKAPKPPKPPKAKKPPKPKKAPKPPKEPKPKKGKPTGPTTEGEDKRSKLPLVIIIAVLVISSLVAGSIVFNFFGVRDFVRDTLISAVLALDPDFATAEQELARRESRINAREQELIRLERFVADIQEDLIDTDLFVPPGVFDTFEDYIGAFAHELVSLESQLNTRATQLDRREAALDRREVQVTNRENLRIPLFRRDLTEEEIADITSLSRSFSQMSPDEAAEILTELGDLNHVATILFFMTERNAAAILATLDVDLAAELTEILLVD